MVVTVGATGASVTAYVTAGVDAADKYRMHFAPLGLVPSEAFLFHNLNTEEYNAVAETVARCTS